MNLSDSHSLIHESDRSCIYFVSNSEYGQPVAVKVLKTDALAPSEVSRLENEYEFTKDAGITGIRRSLDHILLEQKPALVMAYFHGKTLKQVIRDKPPLIDALQVAVQIVQILRALHQQKVIHRNINSDNILVDPKTQQVQLIDFGLASRFNIKMEYSGYSRALSGDAHYIAPEQTGRMNRIVDYRSDLYSLGVVIYEMLAGRLPFESGDTLELIHAHMARIPTPLTKVAPGIPPLISDIVARLLAKNAEDRYQSAFGLHADLQQCLVALQGAKERGNPEALNFELGRNDTSKTFTLPQTLYGRGREISALLAAFERVANGSRELFVITGHPGIGKTSLVAEVYKPITERRAYFIRGKFDQLRSNTPYSAFIQAFDQFIDSILNESEEILQAFRNKITAALEDTGSVLSDVIPRLEDIIGKQLPVPKLSGRESRFRLNRTFQKFLGAVSRAEHPLVVFIDDWQWADAASLELLEAMFSEEVGGHLLVIMAYRDNEVSYTHPLSLALSDLESEGIRPHVINLKLLEASDINMLVADTLKSEPVNAWSLTKAVFRITRGNPFFNNQLLNTLYAEGIIFFDDPARCWRYDISQADKLGLTDDVVLFLAQRLKKLPREMHDVLTLAACIGSRFDLEMLATVSRKSIGDTAALLKKVLQEGLLIPPKEGDKAATYRFIHDRVQQAAYSLISEKEKQETHLTIGNLLLENSLEHELNEKIFEIVNHLNRAKELDTASRSRMELSRLNFLAGQKAKSAAAFASAWSYFKTGLELLPADAWQTRYPFTLDLYKASVEASFFSGDTEATNNLIDIVNREAKTLLDTIRVNDIKILILGAERKFEEAIQTGLKLLKRMGVHFPEKINQENVEMALRDSYSWFRGKDIEAFVDLPQMTDPIILGALQIMESLMGAAFLSSPHLYTLLALERMNLIIKHGNYPKSTFCFASFGSVLCNRAGDIEAGFQFGELALALLHRTNARELVSRVHLLVYGFIIHWKRPLQEIMVPIRTGYYSGLETGDLEFAGHNALFYSNNHLYAGIVKNLYELQKEIFDLSQSLYQLKNMTIYQYLQIALQVIDDLREGRSDARYLRGEYYDETVMLPRHLEAGDQNGLYYLNAYKLLVNYLFGDYEQAVQAAEQALRYAPSTRGLAVIPVFFMIYSLAAMAAYLERPSGTLEQLLSKIDANQERMKTWAHHAPMNCLHKSDLIEAVRHHLLGEKGEAIDAFDRAIAGAKKNGYFRDQALANELAARFYLDWGKENMARDHMQSAYSGYLRWGAAAKADQLKRSHSGLLASIPPTGDLPPENGKPQGLERHADVGIRVPVDLYTVIKASQAIAGEIELERLLRQMLLIMFENAGAQRGALILKEADEWVIQAQGDVDSGIDVLQAVKLRNSTYVAVGMVHEAARSRNSLVLDNASSSGDYIYDPYIARHQIKSVLCMPLINQGALSGILYLENNLATHAFTAKRLELLNLLSAQMALSLDNARLFQQAQLEIAERKVAEKSLLESRQKFKTIFDSVNDAIFVFELSTGMVLDVNKTMCEMYGYTREEALTKRIGDLSSGEYPYTEDVARTLSKKATTENVQIMEWVAKGKGDRLFWVEANLRRALIGGKMRMLVTARDISARKQAEMEIEKLNQELEQRVITRTRQLEAANKELRVAQEELVKRERLSVLGQLTATVSHELRNPLGVIRSSNYFLRRKIKGQDPKTEKHFKRIDEQISLCNVIVEELLEFTRTSAIALAKEPLAPLVETVVAQLKETAGIEIKTYLAPDLSPIDQNREKMRRVLTNVLTNAIQAVQARSDEAVKQGRAYTPDITIDVSQTADTQIVTVADNGVGMHEEVCRQAFEPLFTTRAQGTGIGLANVKKIVEEHGGRITLESTIHQGTRIVLSLPLARGEDKGANASG